MKSIISLLLLFLTIQVYSQNDDYSIIYFYRHKDLISKNKNARILIDNKLRIGIEGGCFDTIHIKNGCYDLKTNKNKAIYNKCFESEKYYYRIDYQYIFMIGKFNLIEVTESFALNDMQNLKMKSLRPIPIVKKE